MGPNLGLSLALLVLSLGPGDGSTVQMQGAARHRPPTPKYECDQHTGECATSTTGTFQTQQICEESCEADGRDDDGAAFVCVTGPSGRTCEVSSPGVPKADCEAVCGNYVCDRTAHMCKVSTNGTGISEADCDAACGNYACDRATGTCKVSPTGAESQALCDGLCQQATPGYVCKRGNGGPRGGVCLPSSAGIPQADCEAVCGNYVCDPTTHTCKVSTSGTGIP